MSAASRTTSASRPAGSPGTGYDHLLFSVDPNSVCVFTHEMAGREITDSAGLARMILEKVMRMDRLECSFPRQEEYGPIRSLSAKRQPPYSSQPGQPRVGRQLDHSSARFVSLLSVAYNWNYLRLARDQTNAAVTQANVATNEVSWSSAMALTGVLV